MAIQQLGSQFGLEHRFEGRTDSRHGESVNVGFGDRCHWRAETERLELSDCRNQLADRVHPSSDIRKNRRPACLFFDSVPAEPATGEDMTTPFTTNSPHSWLCHPLAIVLLLACIAGTGFAVATTPHASFLTENEVAMKKMMSGMMVTPTGDVDRDFAAMMIPHHQGAIDMALAELRYGRDEKLRRLEQEIVVSQQQEIMVMRKAMDDIPAPSSPSASQLELGPGAASAVHAIHQQHQP
jgi:hypothetical protein